MLKDHFLTISWFLLRNDKFDKKKKKNPEYDYGDSVYSKLRK